MAAMKTIKSKGREKLARLVLETINEVGQDNIIQIIEQGPDGKFAGGGLLANYTAYVYYRD